MSKIDTPLPKIDHVRQILGYHWRHAMRYPKEVTISFVIGPATIVVERYIAPLLIASLLTDIQHGIANLSSSLWLIIGYSILQLISFVIGYRVNLYAMWVVQVKASRDIYQEAYEAISHRSVNFHNDHFAGSLVSQVNKTASAFMNFWNVVIFEAMFVAVSIIATIIGISFISLPMGIALILFVALFIISAITGNRFMRPRQKARSESYTKISAQLSDSISNMFTVKIESNEQTERHRLDQALNTMLKAESRVRSGVMTTTTITSFVAALARIMALVFSVWAVQQGLANAAAVYLIVTYTFNLISEVWNINTSIRSVYQIVGDSEEMLEIMREPAEIQETHRRRLQTTKGALSINSLSFTHQGGKPLFQNLNLAIPAGQKVGIVGVSGSGKTTLTKLLLRLIEPQGGSITIDNQTINKVSLASLHESIAYVPQEPLLFHRSLRENIAYAHQDASIEQILKAAKQANALEFINDLPDGLDTLVGERGVKLSGGQRQRIAIARAILKDAPILILDEATSALDSESEKLIQDALEKLMKGRTSIVIAHRLSTIAKLDRIIVMDHGTIVEDGTHQELNAQHGIYAKLWAHQSGGFIEE